MRDGGRRRGEVPSVGVRHFEIFDHPYLPQVQEAAIVFERVWMEKTPRH